MDQVNEHQSKLVLQINSLPILERLIGGDSEVEIDVRNNIVQAFSKKHLRNIAVDLTHANVQKIVTAALDEYVIREGWYAKVKLSPKVVELIKTAVDTLLTSSIDKLIADQRINVLKIVNERLDKLAEQQLAMYTDEELEKKLEVLVNKRIHERLKLS